jgi:hypothetical protein
VLQHLQAARRALAQQQLLVLSVWVTAHEQLTMSWLRMA